jgi:hypothetical protein
MGSENAARRAYSFTAKAAKGVQEEKSLAEEAAKEN